VLSRLLGALYRRWIVPRLEREVSRILLQQHQVWGDPSRVSIAPTAQVNNTLFNTSSGAIRIEDHVMCSHNVCLITGEHAVESFRQDRMDTFAREGRDIVVRKGAWIGSNATVLGPCEVGEDAVVAAGAVVIEDVPPRTVVAGVPARVVKKLPGPEGTTGA
jgi:acetyltransferase-like isoleucine patch superfamily enzyme